MFFLLCIEYFMLIKSKHRNFSVFHKGGKYLLIKKWGKTRTFSLIVVIREQKSTVGVGENQWGLAQGIDQAHISQLSFSLLKFSAHWRVSCK